MKRITVSVDDEVLTTVRRYAAARNTSVNALIREYFTNLAGRERLRQLIKRSQGSLGKRTWTRSDLHER